MVLLMRISFFRLPVTCCQDEEISPVVFLLACFSSRCASRGKGSPKRNALRSPYDRNSFHDQTRTSASFIFLLFLVRMKTNAFRSMQTNAKSPMRSPPRSPMRSPQESPRSIPPTPAATSESKQDDLCLTGAEHVEKDVDD